MSPSPSSTAASPITTISAAPSGNRLIGAAKFSSNSAGASDAFGHGTHVAGIIAGAGVDSNGAYVGIAPQAHLLNVKVSDDQGAALTSDLVSGLQWVLNNKSALQHPGGQPVAQQRGGAGLSGGPD